MSFDWSADVSCHKHCGKTWTKFYCRKYFTKMFTGTDKISEDVNDSDSDGSILVKFVTATCARWNTFSLQ
jgi:hypothetical protein